MRLISYIASSTSVPGDVLKTKRKDAIIDSIQHPPPWWIGTMIGIIIPFLFGVFYESFTDSKIGIHEVIFKLLIILLINILIYILGCVYLVTREDE
jgi:hypothetical protein